MDVALRLGYEPIHRQHVLPDFVRQGQMVPHQMLDVVQATVVVMLMVVLMPVLMVMVVVQGMVLLFPVDQHGHMAARDAALLGLFQLIFHPGDAQGVQFLHEPRRVRQQLDERRGEHIPRRAHGAV